MEPDEEEANGHHRLQFNSKHHLHNTEDFTNSVGDELCDTCSGDTDDIVSVCSWTTDHGDWDRPHALETVSCSYSTAPAIDDRSSSGSGSGSEGAYDGPLVSRCAQAAMDVSASSDPADPRMQYGYNGYVPVWVPMAALSPAWNYGMLPDGKGPHNVKSTVSRDNVRSTESQDHVKASLHAAERSKLQGAPNSGPMSRSGPVPHSTWRAPANTMSASTQSQKRRGKARKQLPVGSLEGSSAGAKPPAVTAVDSAAVGSWCAEEVHKRVISNADGTLKGHDDPSEAPTTIILRNFPMECTRDVLLEVMDAEGFSGAYDFVHMPVDFQTKISLGYALVNMVSHNAALCLWQHFQGFDRWPVGAQQPCEVAWNSPNQGLAAQIDRYRNSPLMHPSVPETYRPVLLRHGVRVDFPAPTSRIRPPRIRHQKQSAAEC